MAKSSDVNDRIRSILVEREVFEAAVRRLTRTSPAPRAAISQRLERERRHARIRAKLLTEHSR